MKNRTSKDKYLLTNSSVYPSELYDQNQCRGIKPNTVFTIKDHSTNDYSLVSVCLDNVTMIDSTNYSYTGHTTSSLRIDGYYYREGSKVSVIITTKIDKRKHSTVNFSKSDRQGYGLTPIFTGKKSDVFGIDQTRHLINCLAGLSRPLIP
ncbi:hypothetical protein J6X90_04020 [Candidatus Saccharibacteria bacterium]|nr:hypothetical protein [Candidatus Saccharibacteria bacterium]